jgi:hypothetical protein
MKPELIVLTLALILVVAVANTLSLSSEVRLILFLLALVAIILAGLHNQGMIRPRPPTRSSWSRQAVSGLSRHLISRHLGTLAGDPQHVGRGDDDHDRGHHAAYEPAP